LIRSWVRPHALSLRLSFGRDLARSDIPAVDDAPSAFQVITPQAISSRAIFPQVSQQLQGHEIGKAIIQILPQCRKRRHKKYAAEFAMEEARVVLAQFAQGRTAMEKHKFFLPMTAHVVLNKLRREKEYYHRI